jgi:hypothetical protein
MSGAWATRWITAWLGAAAIASVNGAIREATYGKRMEERRAQGFSGISLVGALTLYFWALQRRWPIPSRRGAARIGVAWVALTVAFEFGLGRGVQKQSWDEMLSAYNLAQGQTWPLVLAWIGLGPEVVRRLQGLPTRQAGRRARLPLWTKCGYLLRMGSSTPSR